MKGQSQLKRGTEETAKLLLTRQAVFKEKYPVPASTRAAPRSTKNILGLHFEFPDTERGTNLSRVTSSHRRVSSTEVGRCELLGQLLRLYNLLRTAVGNLPEVPDAGSEKSVAECLEAGVVVLLTQLKAKEQEVEGLSVRVQAAPREIEQQKRLLSGQEDELRQARVDLDQSREMCERTFAERLRQLEEREAAIESREKETQAILAQMERDRIALTTACAKMRKRAKDAESQVKRLQTTQNETTRCSEVQTRLKNIVRQESLLNAVAEDLQYQRSSLLAKLETTLTEIAPVQDADSSKPNFSEEICVDFNPLKDCSNSISSRERARSKDSTQRLYRTLSRERPVDITEIYSEIEGRNDTLDLTPKGVLTPKSLRSSVGS